MEYPAHPESRVLGGSVETWANAAHLVKLARKVSGERVALLGNVVHRGYQVPMGIPVFAARQDPKVLLDTETCTTGITKLRWKRIK